MAVRVAINGFGRIGRAAAKIALKRQDVELVAVNDLTDVRQLALLFAYDTSYGRYEGSVQAFRGDTLLSDSAATPHEQYFNDLSSLSGADTLVINGQRVAVTAQKDPALLPWKEFGVDVVLECTGFFTDYEKASAHITAGARRVVISAPGKGEGKTFVLGTPVGGQPIDADVLSNASCTTNCISPVVAVLDETIGIARAWVTTVHSYTADQNLVDGPHKSDMRRARAGALNIIPTTTGAAKAATEVVPALQQIFDGVAIRVPTGTVSISVITCLTKRATDEGEVNRVLSEASADTRYQGILALSNAPLVSADFKGNMHSAIVDTELTKVIGGDFVTVCAWYDNEWGYAARLVDVGVLAGLTA